VRKRKITSLNLELQEYRHRITRARHIHLETDDTNNVFLVAFLTVPQDSRGVAHILEHTVLCGSQRYPVRDPFFMMLRRSLNTFMNAFTSSDWTAYPFATQNRKDFSNLLDVYLDAAFFPLLDELDFAQEGHRIEFATPNDPDSNLVFKGIVFNEMKGAMSSPVDRLAQELQSQLFPTTTYHYNSGGEPECIPDLTYPQLKAFHARHYHPSNAIFMTYGDIPAAEHHVRFEKQVLQHFSAQDLDFQIPDEQRFRSPISVRTTYDLDSETDPSNQTHIVLGWLLEKNTNPRAVLEMRILADVLMDNSSSPLRHALETSPLGTAPSPLCGFDNSTYETTFVAGLEGSNPEHAQAVEKLILDVIAEIAENGAPPETLASVLHQLELSQREITGDGYPYGLRLILDALTPAIHGGDPLAALDLDPLLEELRETCRNPEFIKQLARRLLLDNAHRVQVVMTPEPGLAAKQIAGESQRLAAIKASLGPKDHARIMKQAQALAMRQARVDDPELLPRVTLQDVPAYLKIAEGIEQPVGKTPATWYAQGTNGMVYVDLIVDLPHLDPALTDLLPLYSLCLSEVGNSGRDYLETQALQAAVTGGISARCLVRSHVDDVNRVRGVMALGGKALKRNHTALVELLSETFTSVRFDELNRLRELVAQWRAQREENVTQHGHSLAMAAASAGISPTGALAHRWEGLGGLKTLKALDRSVDNQPGALAALARSLEQIHEQILRAPRQLLVVGEIAQHGLITEDLTKALALYPEPDLSMHPFELEPVDTLVRQGWRTSTQVNFCAKAYSTVPQSHPDAPALQVLGDFLRNGFLHQCIRERGGAYGAGASYQADSGAFRFFSYRDPRLTRTLADFDLALDWLQSTRHTERTLEEAILGVIAAIDRPGSPAGEAISAFFGTLFGRNAEQRRAFRQQILGVSLNDLKRVAATHLIPGKASVAVVSDAATLAKQQNLKVLTL
jgi:hypothetical protein